MAKSKAKKKKTFKIWVPESHIIIVALIASFVILVVIMGAMMFVSKKSVASEEQYVDYTTTGTGAIAGDGICSEGENAFTSPNDCTGINSIAELISPNNTMLGWLIIIAFITVLIMFMKPRRRGGFF